MIDGREFLYAPHLTTKGYGLFLPYAAIPAGISEAILSLLHREPGLKAYVPYLLETDFSLYVDVGDGSYGQFILAIASERKSHLPHFWMDKEWLKGMREKGSTVVDPESPPVDVTDAQLGRSSLQNMSAQSGFVIAGTFPLDYSNQARDRQKAVSDQCAAIIMKRARVMKQSIENSKVFLSHKGIDKYLVSEVDAALRTLNLKTWLDRDDLHAGQPLVRGVDEAFEQCSAAVFFISKDYTYSGVIEQEVDRAVHERTLRPTGFTVIPLVLRQHGGTDELVPSSLRRLTWKTVDDVQIVPTIIRALPALSQDLIRYKPLK